MDVFLTEAVFAINLFFNYPGTIKLFLLKRQMIDKW